MFDWGRCVRRPTPVGKRCLLCNEEIIKGDRGQFMGSSEPDKDGRLRAVVRPVHIECMMIDTIGHTYGVCSCTGYGRDANARRAIVKAINKARAARLQGPWEVYREPGVPPVPTTRQIIRWLWLRRRLGRR